MAKPAPRKSYLIVVLVIIVALVVIIAKTTTKHETGPNPQSQTAQVPAESPVAKIAAAVPADSTKVGAPEPAPATEPETTAKPASPSEAAPAAKPKPAADQPSAPSAADPKPEPPASPEAEPAAPQEPAKEIEPLPGSKLAECLSNGRPTMADFGAGWCKPCQMMEPVLVQAATRYEGKANVVYVDTDKYPQIARSYRIASIPTQIFFDAEGWKVSQHIGYWPIEDVGRALAAAGVAE